MEDIVRKVMGIINCEDQDVATENANKNAFEFSTQRDLIAGVLSKHIADNHLIPKHLVESHNEGFIHIHDKDYAPLMGQTNCCLVNLEDMLENGFKMNGVSIKQPTNISTAMTLASQIVMAVSGSQYGGISFDRFDEVMAKYVNKSYNKYYQEASVFGIRADRYAREKIEKEVYDACQTLEYQVNTMKSVSGQSPFISIGYGLGTCWESRLVQKMIMQVRIDGLGVEKVTAIFPKLIYSIKEGVNRKKGDPNYDIKQKALECSSKRLYPDILNYDKVVEVTGGFKASMGCRSFLSYWENEKGEEQYSGRCNLGVVTLSLPMIALKAKEEGRDFYRVLDEYLKQAQEVCEFRLEYLSKVKAKSAPILYTEGALMRVAPEDYVLPHLLKRGSSISIGYVGLNELSNVWDNTEHLLDSKHKQDQIVEVLEYINNFVDNLKNETGIGYSVYGTPAESQCKRMRDSIHNMFGDIEGVTDKEYLTNSFHLEASKEANVYERMDFESKFIKYTSGGFISYGELPDMRNNLQALENIWDFSYKVTPYYAINTPSDCCFDCGFEGELTCTSRGYKCPSCGNREQSTLYAIRRVSGYLGQPAQRRFNKGKECETVDRVKNL